MILDFHAPINTSMKINEVIQNEPPRTYRIQNEAVHPDLRVQTPQPHHKNAFAQSSKVQHKPSIKRQVSTRPIPSQIKHKLIQDRLTKVFMRQTNIVKPTQDDIQIARDRVATELKRSDLEHQERLNRM